MGGKGIRQEKSGVVLSSWGKGEQRNYIVREGGSKISNEREYSTLMGAASRGNLSFATSAWGGRELRGAGLPDGRESNQKGKEESSMVYADCVAPARPSVSFSI